MNKPAMAKALSKPGILRCEGVGVGDGPSEELGVTTGDVVGESVCVCDGVGVGVSVGTKVDDNVGVTIGVDVGVGNEEGAVCDAPSPPLDNGVGVGISVGVGKDVVFSIVFPSTSETIALRILNCGFPSKLTMHSVTSPVGPGTSPWAPAINNVEFTILYSTRKLSDSTWLMLHGKSNVSSI